MDCIADLLVVYFLYIGKNREDDFMTEKVYLEMELCKLKRELDELISINNFDFNYEIINLSQKIDTLIITYMKEYILPQKSY